MAVYAGPDIVEDGLVLFLDAANPRSYPRSGTTWFDLSGLGNHGTLQNGASFNINIAQGSIVFDGTNDFVNGSFSCNKTFYSLDWWEYPLTASNYNNYIQFDPADADGWGSFLFHYGVGPAVFVGTSTSSRMIIVSNIVDLNQWQHYAWTFNNGAARIYRNGNLIQSSTLSLSTNSTFTGWNISRPGSGQQINGYVSNFRVYSNKVLSAFEVLQNYNALRGRFNI